MRTKNIWSVLITLLILCCSTAVHAQKASVSEANLICSCPAGYTPFRQDFINKISQNIPATTIGKPAFVYAVGKAKYGFAPNITISTLECPYQELPDSLKEIMIKAYKSRCPNFRVLSEGKIAIDGMPAYMMNSTSSNTYPGKFYGHPVTRCQVIVVNNGKMVMFTFCSTNEDFATEANAFQEFLGTVKWLRSAG